MFHKEACVAKLLGTHLSVQVHKKVKFPWRDNSSLAVKGLKTREIYCWKIPILYRTKQFRTQISSDKIFAEIKCPSKKYNAKVINLNKKYSTTLRICILWWFENLEKKVFNSLQNEPFIKLLIPSIEFYRPIWSFQVIRKTKLPIIWKRKKG